ncbi:hypothetical protein FOMPIDRAFT_96500 [Fomitopsis schrenkii]|uniref:Zn(2)-C6 fungal-type domain-containing protein n=1 Tax=Fomitopsis schrenkii TaxID=2126942 RepID=S8G783_FOMSC|nr:hypothetical protein FOMPIDRAFT_96500 [Fomitopsis schrenkii]
MAQTCSACRSRKVRCDGATPTCGPCSKARRPIQCTFERETSQPKGPLLQKGNACLACRRKKKKCDAKRPHCTTCDVAGKQHACLYEDNVQQYLTDALIARTRELECRLAVYEGQSSHSASPRSPFPTDETPSLVLPTVPSSTSEDSHMLDLISSGGVPYTVSVPDPSGGSSMSASSSSTQISFDELNDFRATFLMHHGQLGVSLSPEKMQAIVNGDLSGTVVHPVLVYAGQVIGCLFWQQRHRITLNSAVEAMLLKLVEQAMLDSPNVVTRLQVHCLLAIYFLAKRLMREGREQLMKAAQVALHNNLRLDAYAAEVLTSMGDTSEEAQEHICALCQLMYIDKAVAIVFNDPSLLTADLDQQLQTLPYMFPTIFKTNIILLRARSLALLHECRRLVARWQQLVLNMGAFAAQTTLDDQTKWYEDYWELLEDTLEHNSVLTMNTLKVTFGGNREMATVLKTCTILSLTAATELHHLLADHHPESRAKCLGTALEVVNIAKSLRDDEYSLLDPVLGACWSMVATILDRERPHLEGYMQLKSSFNILLDSAHKLDQAMPYLESSILTINNVAPPDMSIDFSSMMNSSTEDRELARPP